jgi:ring-1,2-phenylacetyl-CoA epoxidase subunit PaaE
MPSSATDFHLLKVRQVRSDTRDAIVVTFDVPPELLETFRFTHGQHLALRTRIAGEEVRRCYSICSAVQDEALRIGIKRVEGGLFSSWAHEHLKPGTEIEVMAPGGYFFTELSPAACRHYVAFAAGSGITPIFSIIKTTLLTEPGSRFTLFYGNRSSNTTIFREELADLKDRFMGRFNLVHVMTREHQDLDMLNGRITADRLELLLHRFAPLATVDFVFICGPREMAVGLREKLQAVGFPAGQIKLEQFVSGGTLRPQVAVADRKTAEACEVDVICDGRKRTFTMEKGTETVLDAALRHGIELRYSCKSGVCSTCRCKLTEGQVEMDASYALETYEVERGLVLACQSYPTTARITVDFDHAE